MNSQRLKELNVTIEQFLKIHAYKEGVAAFYQQWHPSECPYSEGVERVLWLEAWNDCYVDARDADRL